ncbi:hypothetical protein PHJA_001064000 [Phtheirospermum japonicum]|uniref:Thioredoxin domain-containing protein n=1 Tax=Phtheirospermum japonicum TaxID=374723 RepID=A0A830BZE6_9LAMI|nr:hypothetical protein PHJA_001064000 [Phtheirospermum japonicum]
MYICYIFALSLLWVKLKRYYTGYPKDLGPSRVIHFTSERDFVQLLHQGHPVVVAFTIKHALTKRLDNVLEEAAAEFDPHVKFMRVDCPKYPGFCIARQQKEYPFIEMFYSPEQAANQGKAVDPSITKYSVKVLPVSIFNSFPCDTIIIYSFSICCLNIVRDLDTYNFTVPFNLSFK